MNTFRHIPFSPFDRDAPFEIYWSRRLPHWRQASRTYFVTFRLADSLPAQAVKKLKEEHDAFLRRHGIELGSDPEATDFNARYLSLPSAVRAQFEREHAARLHRFIDAGYGRCELAVPECATALRECLLKCDGARLHVGDFVIMPNHVHALLTPIGEERLEELLRQIKGASARKINRLMGGGSRSGQLWQLGSFDHIVRDSGYLKKFQRYIAENPVKAGILLGEGCLWTREYG